VQLSFDIHTLTLTHTHTHTQQTDQTFTVEVVDLAAGAVSARRSMLATNFTRVVSVHIVHVVVVVIVYALV